MKSFLKTTVIYFLILALIAVTINGIYVALGKNNIYGVEKFDHVSDGIQVSNFGSSHGLCGFNYEDINDRSCFNFALSAQSLSYDSRLLKYYQDKLAKDGTTYVVVSYFSLFGKNEIDTDSFASKNLRYYRFLPSEYIKEYDAKTQIFTKYLPVLSRGSGLINDFLNRNTDDENWQRTADLIDVSDDALRKYKEHVVADKLDATGERIYNQEEIEALYEIIRLCREKGVEPVLVTTPFLSEYTDTIAANDPEFFEEFRALVDQIVQDTGVRYYDYSRDERFIYDYSLFRDTDHMNKEGARRFTGILIEETLTKNNSVD